jgi:hypothetical protein
MEIWRETGCWWERVGGCDTISSQPFPSTKFSLSLFYLSLPPSLFSLISLNHYPFLSLCPSPSPLLPSPSLSLSLPHQLKENNLFHSLLLIWTVRKDPVILIYPFIYLPQLDAALTMDAVTVITEGLNSMLQVDQEVFRNTFRRGLVYNNGSRGVNCRKDPPIPWKHGPALIRAFKQVPRAQVPVYPAIPY